MTIALSAHNKNSIWNFFDANSDVPQLSSWPIDSSSTSSLVISTFKFDGQTIECRFSGNFASNPSSFGTLGNLSQGSNTVISYELFFDGQLSESATYNPGVSFSQWHNALGASSRSELQQLYSGDDIFTGSQQAGADNDDGIHGYGGNDVFYSNGASSSGSNSDKFFGGDGMDTLVLRGAKAAYAVTQQSVWMPDNLEGPGYRISDSTPGRDGIVSVRYVERLHFADKKIALDVTDNALETLQFIGVIAPSLQSNLNVRGTILSLFDQGKSMQEMSQLALDVGLITSDNTALAKQVFKNVFNTTADPDQGLTNTLVNFIEQNGDAKFLATVAGLNINVDLVGLQQHGMEFI